MTDRRVMVTGFGTVNPAGPSIEETWDAVRSGQPVPRSPATNDSRPLPRVAENKTDGLPIRPRDLKRMSRSDSLAVVAAARAMCDAGWNSCTPSDSTGLFLGTIKDTSPYNEFLQLVEPIARRGFKEGAADMVEMATRYLTPFMLLDCMPNLALHYISEMFKLRGDNSCFLHTGAAGNSAVMAAYNAICSGQTKSALAGGFDSSLDRLSMARLSSLGLLSEGSAEATCKPFDLRRNGVLPSEGASVFFLEERESALERGAAIQGEILGGGSACEPALDPARRTGQAVDRALTTALANARLAPNEIGFIVACGEGTCAGDRAEASGIRAALKCATDRVPVTAFKGVFGHQMAGSGPLDGMLACKALYAEEIPSICGCDEPDENCAIHLVCESLVVRADVAVTIATGMGGQVCAVVWGKGDW